MNSKTCTLARLQEWYASMCNGDWEHTYGIFINNIDNPGWSLKVELKDSYLYDVEFKQRQIQRSEEDDWIFCHVVDGEFVGYGGPGNLGEIIELFLTWANSSAV